MVTEIEYKGIIYRKHPHQKYFYCSQSLLKTRKLYSRSLHRQMWYDAYGEIPVGYQVHHKDRNAFNNTLNNFELKESKWHASYHAKEKVERDPNFFKEFQKKGIAVAPLWHKSEIGREWHKQNAKNMGLATLTYGLKKCDNCNKEFTLKSKNGRFCSNACKSAWRRKNNPDMAPFNCLTCGKEYITLKYLPVKYCSKECRPAPNPIGGSKKKIAVVH